MPSDKTTKVCAARARKFEKFYLLHISAANFTGVYARSGEWQFFASDKKSRLCSVCELHVIRCRVVRAERKEGQSRPLHAARCKGAACNTCADKYLSTSVGRQTLN